MPQFEDAKRHLADLVAFDTTSAKPNRPIIDHIAAFLRHHGIDPIVLADATGDKANLIASIGPADVPGLVLSGHTDVVPALEKTWTSPPFQLSERNGRLYGRGACDMKGFVACMMAMVPQLVRAELHRPIWLCFSYDEEVGCLGAPVIARWLRALTAPPMLAIIGEPTTMQLVTGQKGKIAMRCHVRGSAGHSSFAPHHVNAIEWAARIMVMISDQAEALQHQGPFDKDFTVPSSTMLTTLVTGGVATNITPDSCSFAFEIRSLPNHDAHAVLNKLKEQVETEVVATMRQRCATAGVEWEQLFSYPAMGDCSASAGFASVRDSMPPWGGKVSYGSEGGVFQTIGGIPSVIVGPGSIEQAHKPDEFLEISQMDQCLRFLEQLATAGTR